MTNERRAQCIELWRETIYPALCEDFNFTNPNEIKEVVEYLKERLEKVNPYEVLIGGRDDN